jgi:hypothetical protein
MPQASGKVRLCLPEERFWKRYSPHHELPLSAVSSVVVHLLGFFTLMLVVGGLVYSLRDRERLPELGAVLTPGREGGHPKGVNGGTSRDLLPVEALLPAQEGKPEVPRANPSEKLQAVPTPPTLLELGRDKDAERLLDRSASAATSEALKHLSEVAGQEIARLSPPKGPGSHPIGDPRTPRGSLDPQSIERQLRWTMLFNTRDGEDYLRQLRALGAILAIPQDNGQFLVIRDLSQRPAAGRVEDISQSKRIHWVDGKPESVQPLATALGLRPPPRLIAAFFPEMLEKELRQKEARRFRGPESDIEETKFQIVPRRGSYEPEVLEVIDKQGRKH